MPADQYKQIGIREGARAFQLRGCFMKQNYNLKFTGIKGPIRKI
jgi:hypothetical protein